MSNVIIVGGGMVGATLALVLSALTKGRLRIDLVEACCPLQQEHPGFDARVIALAEGTCQHLARVGIWSALAECATPLTEVHVTDQYHAGTMKITAQQYHLSALGYVVELHEVGKRLFEQLAKTSNVRLHCPAKVVAVQRELSHVTVELDTGEHLTGDLLVAADGSFSTLARLCQHHWQEKDYQQLAVIANVMTTKSHHGRAFERFTANGPLALLPMTQQRSSLVWCHPQANSEAVRQWDDDYFLAQLQRTFGWRLGAFLQTGQRQYYPLRLRTAEQLISHRLVLVGNAAQTLHPIAGQGFNLGLRDVMSLAENLSDAWKKGKDIGAYTELDHYQQQRQKDRQKTIRMTDGLVHIFANRWFPLVAARNVGLMFSKQYPKFCDRLIYRTLGWVER